jgi:glycosyltransferase involved in cell wall biosynthesis
MLATIIIPCRNEERYIRDALESVFNSDLPDDQYEVLVVDGMSSDDTVEILNQIAAEHDNVRVLKNPDRTVPFAMNIGIRQAAGEYIIRLDAHCEYPPNYFSELIKHQKELQADNVGTAILSLPKTRTRKTMSIAAVLSDPIGVGNSHFRIGVDKIRQVDTVPFGCYPREVFERVGLYDERLTRSQDIELNKRIVRSGGKIYILPHIKLKYYIRESWRALWKKYLDNGMWNILVAKYTGTFASLSLRNYVPMLFVATILLTSVLAILTAPVGLLLFALPVLYVLIVLVRSIQIHNSQTSIPALMWTFIVLHFAHGLGGIRGLIRQFAIRRSRGSKPDEKPIAPKDT